MSILYFVNMDRFWLLTKPYFLFIQILKDANIPITRLQHKLEEVQYMYNENERCQSKIIRSLISTGFDVIDVYIYILL